MSTNKSSSGCIPAFILQCLFLCVALEISGYWSASIGMYFPFNMGEGNFAVIHETRWTTKLSYVCQYHSKSLYGLSLSVYQSVTCQWID